MAIIGKQSDILGTYLETMKGADPLDLLLREIRVSGPAIPLANVASALGLADDEFARLVLDAEKKGMVKRDRSEGRITLSLTQEGLAREAGARQTK